MGTLNIQGHPGFLSSAWPEHYDDSVGVVGSNPTGNMRRLSSVGRASGLHPEGRGFKPLSLHCTFTHRRRLKYMKYAETKKLESHLTRLAKRRKSKTVTVDDAHKYLDKNPALISTHASQLICSVFNKNTSKFTPKGTVASTRPEARGRKVTTWELAV